MVDGDSKRNALWIATGAFSVLAVLIQTLLITGCVPPLAGQESGLSDLHIMEFQLGRRTVRFGYVAFCVSALKGGKVVQICNTLDSAVRPNADVIMSRLPQGSVDPNLFRLAFQLNRTVFPIIPAVTLTFLVLAPIALMVGAIGDGKQKKMGNLAALGCFGIAFAMSMTSAVAFTLGTAGVANTLQLTTSVVTAARGSRAFGMQWASLVLNALPMVTAVLAQKADGYGGGGGDDGGYEQY